MLLAARELSYRPSRQARALSRGRSFIVGLVSHNVSDRFLMPLLSGVQGTLERHDMSVFLCEAHGDFQREDHYVRLLLERNVDGLIIMGPHSNPRPPLTNAPKGFPLVYAYGPSENPEDMSVISDDVGGGRLAAQRLLDIGRERLALLSGPLSYRASTDRERGMREVLAANGLELPRERIVYGEWQEPWGRRGADRLLDLTPAVDGIFCGNDQLARGAADALRERGVTVPGDVALVGFDNWDVVVEGSRPPLTTVDPDLAGLGVAAADHLLSAMSGDVHRGVHALPARLVVRQSG